MYEEIVTKKLVLARDEAGYTQMQVSEITKILPSKIAKIEKGKQRPDVETIGVLAELYDVSIDWLFGIGKKKR